MAEETSSAVTEEGKNCARPLHLWNSGRITSGPGRVPDARVLGLANRLASRTSRNGAKHVVLTASSTYTYFPRCLVLTSVGSFSRLLKTQIFKQNTSLWVGTPPMLGNDSSL